MNLSALNKLGANGPGINHTEASSPDNALSRLSSSALSGADFASFLHNQIQALKQPQRQHLAGDQAKLPPAPAERSAHSSDRHNPQMRAKTAQRDNMQEAGRSKSTQDNDAAAKLTQEYLQPLNNSGDHTELSDQTAGGDEELAQDKQARESDTDTSPSNAPAQPGQKTLASATSMAAAELKPAEQSGTADKQESDITPAKSTPDLSGQPGALTTIALSDNLQIITTAQTAPSEKSVADFALAMGLEPGQVKELFGSSSAAASTSANMKTGLSTKDMLGINAMPSYTPPQPAVVSGPDSQSAGMQPLVLNKPVSSADFQALQKTSPATDAKPGADWLAKLDNLQVQTGALQIQQTAIAPPPSTLSVLSMLDAQLRTEDIESLKQEFDAIQAAPAADVSGENLPAPMAQPGQRNGHPATTPAAPVFANNPDLAQTYENLSRKLTTELAARMHEKLNAGEWTMKFALKPASLGLVGVQLEMRNGKLTAQFQSDTALTQGLIQNGSQRLKDALADLGMNNASVLVGQGQSQSAGQSGQNNPQGQTGLPEKREENRAKLTEESGPKIAQGLVSGRSKRSQFDSYA
ncbi:MAG: flagellar hook-length control protein FliK [Limnohabitans sp.]|nr:flagellar hook-length control protein FliK [Limnohabitans sp.]